MNAYVNTIGYDFPGASPHRAVSRSSRPAGRSASSPGDLAFPNGMAITADGATLVVAESTPTGHGLRHRPGR